MGVIRVVRPSDIYSVTRYSAFRTNDTKTMPSQQANLRVVVHDGAVGLVVHAAQVLLGNGETNRVGNTLAKGTCGTQGGTRLGGAQRFAAGGRSCDY